jgi:hypothetical protein
MAIDAMEVRIFHIIIAIGRIQLKHDTIVTYLCPVYSEILLILSMIVPTEILLILLVSDQADFSVSLVLRSKYTVELALRPAASLAVSRTAKDTLQMMRPINNLLLNPLAMSFDITVALAVFCKPTRIVKTTIEIVSIVTFFFI